VKGQNPDLDIKKADIDVGFLHGGGGKNTWLMHPPRKRAAGLAKTIRKADSAPDRPTMKPGANEEPVQKPGPVLCTAS
jgi:hypothetical protein